MIHSQYFQKHQNVFYSFTMIFIIIFVAACTGILTRPLSYSAFFWPANGILLGLLIRYPYFRNIATFIGASFGYITADLITGTSFILTLSLTFINFIAIYGSYYCYQYFYIQQKYGLNENLTKSTFPLLISTIFASSICALAAVMILPYVPNTFMGHEHQLLSFLNWWSGELLNFVMIVPILITSPSLSKLKQTWLNIRMSLPKLVQLKRVLPFIAVIASCVLTHFYFAPGALFYPLATMMWAAAVYSLFSMSLITTVVCLTLYHSLSSIYLHSTETYFIYPMLSIRIGLIILGITTLYMCVINIHRRKIFKKLKYLANYDDLTKILNRRQFIQLADQIITREKNYPLGVMMIDIDHFKKLNDTYGHASGDLALHEFSCKIKSSLRTEDLFCRIGGEEFSLLLQQTNKEQCLLIAERIRLQIERLQITTQHNQMIGMTLSIGVVHVENIKPFELKDLLSRADEALYFSKQNGRNQVTLYQHINNMKEIS